MKGLLLSGGKGSRLRPLTYTRAKQLIPIANKPIIFYALESLSSAGITDIGVVVGETKDEIMEALGDGSKFGVRLTYIDQKFPLGLADAVLAAEGFIGHDRFVMFLGDNFIEQRLHQFVGQYQSSSSSALLLLARVEQPERFGVVEMKEGHIVRLIEKPKHPPSNLALVGIYFFDHHIFDAAKKIKPSFRNELEITDAIQKLIDDGLPIEHETISGWWKDTGTLVDLLEANRMALEWVKPEQLGSVEGDSTLQGRVHIGKNTTVKNSTIRGPVILGEGCRLEGAFVGPFTSIGNRVTIIESEIEHSIVLDGASIEGVDPRIQDSLLGCEAKVSRGHLLPKALKFMIGDNSEVIVNS